MGAVKAEPVIVIVLICICIILMMYCGTSNSVGPMRKRKSDLFLREDEHDDSLVRKTRYDGMWDSYGMTAARGCTRFIHPLNIPNNVECRGK